MKLLLTSTGLTHPEIKNAFKELAGVNLLNVVVALVPTASRSIEELEYVKRSQEELINIGILATNIKIVDFANKADGKIMRDCNILYVCGGNTFHLLNEVKKNGYETEIKKFINKNKLYVGVSAGTLLVTPNIRIANTEPADPNDVYLKDFSSLGIVSFEISPHSPEMVPFESVEKYAKENKTKIYAISNRTALKVEDDKLEIVGEGNYRLFDFK